MKRAYLSLLLSTIALVTSANETSPVRITREPLSSCTISPYQYGQFVEYLCNLVPSMWAEKLYDGSFEGLTPYNFVFLKETDFKEKPWYPSGQVNRAEFTLDKSTKVSGDVSKKIAIENGAPAVAGISQDGIFVERNEPCDFNIWLRAENVSGRVRVYLHHEHKIYAECEFHPTSEWKKFNARLQPSTRDIDATLTIEFRGGAAGVSPENGIGRDSLSPADETSAARQRPGTLWLENASLMPANTVGGWRPDVVEALRALKPGVIRFGGSALDAPGYGEFEWKNTIGDPDHRKPFRAWGGLQPTGPGLEEFVQLCRVVDAEPLICVRFIQRTPRDAADQVEYFNGSTNTAMGAWRAKNGHPQPYAIKFWQVGNEILSADYDAHVAEFCEAMKRADPSIKLLSSFPSAASTRNAAQWLDYICPHHYGCANLPVMETDFANLRKLLHENAPNHNIKLAITEWNTTAGDAGPRRAMLWTLANALACSRYHNLMHRQCDIAEIANRSNLANSFCSGIIQTDNSRLYKTPTYFAQQLYATLAGNRPLRIDVAAGSNTNLDLSATLTTNGDAVVLFAVNDTRQPITLPLDFSAFGKGGQKISVWTLADSKNADEPDAANSFAEPERIAATQKIFRASSEKFEYKFPPLSLTVLRWKVR